MCQKSLAAGLCSRPHLRISLSDPIQHEGPLCGEGRHCVVGRKGKEGQREAERGGEGEEGELICALQYLDKVYALENLQPVSQSNVTKRRSSLLIGLL